MAPISRPQRNRMTRILPAILEQIAPFDRLHKASPLGMLRDKAWANWRDSGLPGPHLEDWKYTNLRGLDDLAVTPPVRALPSLPGISDTATAVLVDGVFQRELSNLQNLPKGVIVKSLAQAMMEDADVVAGILGKTQPTLADEKSSHALVHLNTATFSDGVFVYIPANVRVDRPLHILGYGTIAVRHPRILMSLEAGASLQVIETWAGRKSGFTNLVSEIEMGSGATLQHLVLQDEVETSFHVAHQTTRVAEEASYDTFILQQGAHVARREIRITLEGIKARADLDAVLMASSRQHLDLTSFIDHAASQTLSNSVVKMVLEENARGVYQGKILVRPDSQKVDGNQLAKAILLSRTAEADIKPELEIYADDIKCGHGAAVGELDEAQIFYLMARGIPEFEARQLLIHAFLQEIIDRVPEGILRTVTEEKILSWLTSHKNGEPS